MTPVSYNQEFIDKLKIALSKTLPGKASQEKMASRLRKQELSDQYNGSRAIQSSVLILFYPKNGMIHTILMLRQKYNGVHSGQVSFPGGRFEKEDSDLITTALREAQEEVNIDPTKVEVAGTLSKLYIPPSNFLVLPVVGFTNQIPEFKPDSSEVAMIIESDIDFLFEKNLRKEKIIHVRGYEIEAPYFDVQGHTVWGATAMILSELSDIIKSIA